MSFMSISLVACLYSKSPGSRLRASTMTANQGHVQFRYHKPAA
jgi:hypothetical protein